MPAAICPWPLRKGSALFRGAKGGRLKEIGTKARIDMEKLFGGKVHLEVWVKVKSGWTENQQLLKQLGYG